jgi:nicotinamidase-related amidase
MVKKIIYRILLAIALFIAILAGNLAIFNITATRISEGTPIEDPDSQNTALLVIDIQEGTTGSVSGLKEHKEQAEMLIARVNTLTEEMHARDQLIVYVSTEVVNPLINILNNTMARGSEGAELDSRLVIHPGAVVVKRKNDPFMGTDLDQILADHQIARLVVVGLDAAQCVKSTVLAAHNRGYGISVVEEAVISDKAELKEEAIQEFRTLGVEIVSMD